MHFKSILTRIFLVFSIALSTQAFAEDGPRLDSYYFTPNNDVSSTIDAATKRAEASGKLLMIALGAEWCHDSRGFSVKLSTPEMQAVIKEHYEVVFVDVGYLAKGVDIAVKYGMPIFYGTPTVMIIEPSTGRLMNRAGLETWMTADSHSVSTYVEKFSPKNYSTPDLDLSVNTAQTQAINAFEETQAARLLKAFAVVGPMLQAYKENTEYDKQTFFKQWDMVANYRFQLNRDIVALRKAAANGDTQELELPQYEAFPWETE